MKSIEELVKKGKSEQEGTSSGSLSIGIVVTSIIFSLYTATSLVMDDSPFLYKCPEQVANNITEMKRIDDISSKDVDVMIRTFVRDYIYHRYPKHVDQVKPSYEFIAKHSTGNIKNDFESRLTGEKLENVKNNVKSGKFSSFYPENSLKVRISKRSDGEFIVQIDGRYVKESGMTDLERVDARLELKIERGDPSLSGAINGLYVTDYSLTYTPDAVSGTKEILN